MDDRVIHFRLGLFVVIVVTALMSLFLMYIFGELPNRGQKSIFVRFDDVTGVTQETPVRKNGITIGRVRQMQPVENGAVLSLSIDPRWKLTEAEVCRIGSDNLFGDSVLEFVASGENGASNREIQDGEYLNGLVASDPLDAMRVVVDMKEEFHEALLSIRAAGEEVGAVAESMSGVVTNNQDQFGRILGRTEQALGRFDTAMVSINQVVDDEFAYDFGEALKQVPELIANVNALAKSTKRVVEEAETNLKNVRGITEPLRDHGDAIVAEISSSAARLDDLLLTFQAVTDRVNSGEGTIGQLVHNPELYQKLNRAAHNIEQLSRQLEPIVSDARVAVDKVARNPRILGVQGALQRRTSGIK